MKRVMIAIGLIVGIAQVGTSVADITAAPTMVVASNKNYKLAEEPQPPRRPAGFSPRGRANVNEHSPQRSASPVIATGLAGVSVEQSADVSEAPAADVPVEQETGISAAQETGVSVEQEAAPDTASTRGVIPCEFGDFNNDGIAFGTADVPGFVDAVMGNNPDPICGDMNADGLVDGNDIQLFVNTVLGI